MKLSEVNSVYLKIMLFFFQIVLGLVRELKMSFKNVILRCMILSKKKKAIVWKYNNKILPIHN